MNCRSIEKSNAMQGVSAPLKLVKSYTFCYYKVSLECLGCPKFSTRSSITQPPGTFILFTK